MFIFLTSLMSKLVGILGNRFIFGYQTCGVVKRKILRYQIGKSKVQKMIGRVVINIFLI